MNNFSGRVFLYFHISTWERLGVGICCKWIVGDRLYGHVCRLSIHHYGARASRARPIVVESIMVDGKAANIAIQPIPNDSLTTYTHTKFWLKADLFLLLKNQLWDLLSVQIMTNHYLCQYFISNQPISVHFCPYSSKRDLVPPWVRRGWAWPLKARSQEPQLYRYIYIYIYIYHIYHITFGLLVVSLLYLFLLTSLLVLER